MRFKFSLFPSVATPLLILILLITSCGKDSGDGIIIFTQSGDIGKVKYGPVDSWHYVEHCKLVAIHPDKPGRKPEILTQEFSSARSPEASYDGKTIVFSAKKNENDSWQIWEMNLKNKKYRQVTSASENSINPAYMPGDRIVFSRLLKNDSLKAEHTLFTCNLDGTNLKRITFNPHNYFAPSLLNDGRVITISRQIFPAHGKPVMMVLRPDGTKAELFYRGDEGTSIFSRGRETENGTIVFVETSGSFNTAGSVIAVNYNRPLHSRQNLTSLIKGDFCSVAPFKDGKLIVLYRTEESERYALYEFEPNNKSIGNRIYNDTESDIIEAVFVKVRNIPKKLPSELDQAVKTGLLLCQNINITGMNSPEGEAVNLPAGRIEIMGIDSSLGVIDVEKDGSFYLKVAADMPFKINTLDKEGKLINGPGSWIWLRPNERRGCTGCHEDNEMVPANRLSLAVRRNPVSIPVHVKGIKEKEVELE